MKVLLPIIIILALVLKNSLRKIGDNQRGLLFFDTGQLTRKEVFWDVVNPGWRFVIPRIHRIELVQLEDVSPYWASLSEEELKDQLILKKLGQGVLDQWIQNGRKAKLGGYHYRS